MFKVFSEPVKLQGEGDYNLNALKEIKITDSYLGLNQNIRRCQNEEPLYNCTTKHLIDDFIKKCHCLPFNINLFNMEKVSWSSGKQKSM